MGYTRDSHAPRHRQSCIHAGQGLMRERTGTVCKTVGSEASGPMSSHHSTQDFIMVTEPYDCSRAREWPDLSEAGSERAQGPSGRGVLSNQDHEQPGAELILFPGAIGMFKACELSGLLPEYITSVPFGRRAH